MGAWFRAGRACNMLRGAHCQWTPCPVFLFFTSYSSVKGSFVVCCMIDYNENHSIVAKVDFRKLNCVSREGAWLHEARAARGGGGTPAQIHAWCSNPYPLHSRIPYLLQGESSRKCDYRRGGGKTVFRQEWGGMRGRDKGLTCTMRFGYEASGPCLYVCSYTCHILRTQTCVLLAKWEHLL